MKIKLITGLEFDALEIAFVGRIAIGGDKSARMLIGRPRMQEWSMSEQYEDILNPESPTGQRRVVRTKEVIAD